MQYVQSQISKLLKFFLSSKELHLAKESETKFSKDQQAES